jgi:hypothetical protein
MTNHVPCPIGESVQATVYDSLRVMGRRSVSRRDWITVDGRSTERVSSAALDVIALKRH